MNRKKKKNTKVLTESLPSVSAEQRLMVERALLAAARAVSRNAGRREQFSPFCHHFTRPLFSKLLNFN